MDARSERIVGIFVEGIGAAAATSGVLNQLQGRIFALLYLNEGPLTLDEIAAGLQQSKSNISVNIRGLVDWHLVRRSRAEGSRKDNYVAVTDFWRAMQEIMERRFRWNMRQVLATVDETMRASSDGTPGRAGASRAQSSFVAGRLETMRAFFSAVDAGLAAFGQGESFRPGPLRELGPAGAGTAGKKKASG